MSKEIILFEKETLTFKKKFHYLMDLLISNQSVSRTESTLFLGIFYLQLVSGFFSNQVGVLDPDNSVSDKLLNYIHRVLRLKDLFLGNYSGFQVTLFLLFGVIMLFSIYFLVTIYKTTKNSFYTFPQVIVNFFIKIYIYVAFNMILDMTIANFCFEDSNPSFKEISCSIKKILPTFIISVILLIYSIIFIFFIQFYYSDSLYLSTSFYAKISCNYELYTTLNCIFYSVFLIEVKYLSKEIFLIYNLAISVALLNFYINKYLFYDYATNVLVGLFHILYAWTSLFFLIFAYINFKEKGIIYVISSAIVLYFYFNLKAKIEDKILLETPFYKISNKYYLLYYIKNLIDKMNAFDENPKDKVLLTGIMQMHSLECPNPNCLSKSKSKIYLPMTNKWSDRSKPMIHDQVFLMNYILIIMYYFISQSYYSPEMIINISLYYLQIIGNYCQALFYYKKVKEMKLSLQDKFSLVRLEIAISRALVEKLKPPNEPCFSLEDLNVTNYFKYEDLSQNFLDEMNNDIQLSLEFWQSFRSVQMDSSKTIDFNKIFHLTDKIRITKAKVAKLWDKLFKIFNGVNELFDLYLMYVETINDEDVLKKNLEEVKRKNENSADHIQQNFYSLLFNQETGIIICNGDKGKEGIIEKANSEVEIIFKYKPEELRGMNLSSLMPRLFERKHSEFMQKYFEIGEKRVIDNKDFKCFGKDKENSIIKLRLAIKLFPMLNDSVYFVGLLVKENIDDIIFIDSKFNIQGMSLKLMKILNIQNKLLFQDNDIPFYVICKKFVNFYKIFLRAKKNNRKDKKKKNIGSLIEDTSSVTNLVMDGLQPGEEIIEENNNLNSNDDKENDIHENVEISENIELEYEICLPQFLIDYAIVTAKKDQKSEAKVRSNENSENASVKEENAESKKNADDFGESDMLMDDESLLSNNNNKTPEDDIVINTSAKKDVKKAQVIDNKNNNLTPDGTPTPTPGEDKKEENAEANQQAQNNATVNNNKMDFNKQSDEEKEFKTKIDKHIDLFEEAKFTELEDLIDTYTKNCPNEYKFNFTFDRYRYGEKQMAYIVRCIDNKNEGAKSDDESIIEGGDPNQIKCKKEKTDALKYLVELYENEKQELAEAPDNFISLSLNDKNFQHLLSACKEDIMKTSRIHGVKKQEVQDDENSSQSSSANYNNDLAKKARVEEIRANIMNNVSNFYSLKYIKILVIITGLITLIFCALYIVFFKLIYDDLRLVNNLNVDLFQTTLWMSNLLSTLISLRTLYNFRKEFNQNTTQPREYFFMTFTQDDSLGIYENEEKYFEIMREKGELWYNEIIDNFGELEDKIGGYLEDKKDLFWGEENVIYVKKVINDTESFPFGLGQVLNSINSLLKNENFNITNIEQHTLSQNDKNYIDYIGILGIENAYVNLIPQQFLKIKKIPIIFKDYNESSITTITAITIVYASIVAIALVIYSLLLFITNKNMGEGLLKVTKIRIEKINDIISKITEFNVNYLKKFREKENYKLNNNNQNQGGQGNQNNAEGGQNNQNNNNNNVNQYSSQSMSSSNGFNSDVKKHKSLKILTYSYSQILVIFAVVCGFLIPTFLITTKMIKSTNKLMNAESYLYGKLIISSANTVKVKCMMSQCLIDGYPELTYSDLINKSEVQSIVQGISLFEELANFYNNKFLLNACDTAFNINSEDYAKCIQEPLIQSANNTDSLIKLIDETMENINKDDEMKYNLNYSNEYPINRTDLSKTSYFPYNRYMLYYTDSFQELENIFYKYITPVSDNLSQVVKLSLENYINEKKVIIIILICLLGVIIVSSCVWVALFFVKNLIHLLSVSRCILKIIPTNVINNTQELVSWIENKY